MARPVIGFDKQIFGLELVQHDTQLGGVTLTQGRLLVTVEWLDQCRHQQPVGRRDAISSSSTSPPPATARRQAPQRC